MRPWRSELAERAPQIKVDIHEADGSYTVKAEIPGVRKEDIDVRIDHLFAGFKQNTTNLILVGATKEQFVQIDKLVEDVRKLGPLHWNTLYGIGYRYKEA